MEQPNLKIVKKIEDVEQEKTKNSLLDFKMEIAKLKEQEQKETTVHLRDIEPQFLEEADMVMFNKVKYWLEPEASVIITEQDYDKLLEQFAIYDQGLNNVVSFDDQSSNVKNVPAGKARQRFRAYLGNLIMRLQYELIEK